LHLRGWVNALGLYVQERRAGGRSRLQAGGRFRSYLDAWCEEDGDWQITKFDENAWQLRFAHLVEPTCEIADFLSHFDDLDTGSADALKKAILHYKTTGSWLGLPEVPQDIIRRREEEVARQMEEEEAKRRSQEISYYEKRVKDNAEDSSALSTLALLYYQQALLYQQGGRYKDIEKMLKMRLKADASKQGFQSSTTYMELGKLYLAALSNSVRGKGIPIWGTMPADFTVQILGYEPDELGSLCKQNLSKANEMSKQSGLGIDDLKELALALKAATELSIEAFEEFDMYKKKQSRRSR
jgi:hypothetical protein